MPKNPKNNCQTNLDHPLPSSPSGIAVHTPQQIVYAEIGDENGEKGSYHVQVITCVAPVTASTSVSCAIAQRGITAANTITLNNLFIHKNSKIS